jgi:hypothetical protein
MLEGVFGWLTDGPKVQDGGPLFGSCSSRKYTMKTDLFVSVTIDPKVLESAKGVLLEGENLADFLEQSIRVNVARRQHCREFIARGLASRDEAKRNANYVSADRVIANLTARLDAAKA